MGLQQSSHPCMRCSAAETRCPSLDACKQCLKQAHITCMFSQVQRWCHLPTHVTSPAQSVAAACRLPAGPTQPQRQAAHVQSQDSQC